MRVRVLVRCTFMRFVGTVGQVTSILGILMVPLVFLLFAFGVAVVVLTRTQQGCVSVAGGAARMVRDVQTDRGRSTADSHRGADESAGEGGPRRARAASDEPPGSQALRSPTGASAGAGGERCVLGLSSSGWVASWRLRALTAPPQGEPLRLHVAGLPRFDRFFARDGLVSALLLNDTRALRRVREQLSSSRM